MTYEKLHCKVKINQNEPKNLGELRWSGTVRSSYSTNATRRGTLITNPMINHE